jgi:integrase
VIPFCDFRRVKNKRRRKGVLWPETVDAIEDYLAEREPTVETDKLILNQYGLPYQHLDHGVRRTFNALAKSLGVNRTGRSLGSLRHTFATIATDYADDNGGHKMVSLIMGHTTGRTMTDRYSQRNTNELLRLKRVADAVRRWLFYGTPPTELNSEKI